jgi:hypothetical protein
MSRTFQEEKSFIERIDSVRYKIKEGFVPNMKVGFRVHKVIYVFRFLGCFM